MAKKKREVENPDEAFELLGYNETVTDPEGVPVTTGDEGLPQEQAEQPDQNEEPTEDTSSNIEYVEEEEGEEEAQKPDEAEQQRRSWQAEADKAKAELQKAQEQINLIQAQNQQLLGVVTPFVQKYGNEGQQPQQQGDIEPQADFIEDGYFDGQKFAQYQQKRDEWLTRSLEERVAGRIEKKQQETRLQEQLSAVAKEFPEYVNPLTGEVDTQRVYRDLEQYTSKKSVVDLLREATGKVQKQSATAGIDESLKKIEQNANRPAPVAGSSDSESAIKVKVPKKLKHAHDIFGDMELPPDYGGLSD